MNRQQTGVRTAAAGVAGARGTRSSLYPRRRQVVAAALGVAALVTLGCASSPPAKSESLPGGTMPEKAGMYAYTGDGLVRLDGDTKWRNKTWKQRSSLAPGTEFVIREPGLDSQDRPPSQSIGLRKVAWVRSSISAGGKISPARGGKWESVPVPGFSVPLAYLPDADSSPELVVVRPRRPLEAGLYSLYVRTGTKSRNARFGVAWPGLDKVTYASAVCVDEYTGQKPVYRRCGEGQASPRAARALRIYLVHPQTLADGPDRSLVVAGVIVNRSGRARKVPVLTARLRGSSGKVLAHWSFRADLSRLGRGRYTTFRTGLSHAPSQMHSIHVDFASTPGSG